MSRPPHSIGTSSALLEPDPAREEDVEQVDLALVAAAVGRAEVEDAGVLEEEVPLLREEEREAREVHLLLVDLDLGEVGVVGEVGGERLRDTHLGVEPGLGVVLAIVVDVRPGSRSGRRPGTA